MELFTSIPESGQAVCKFFAAAKRFFLRKIVNLEKKQSLHNANHSSNSVVSFSGTVDADGIGLE